MAWDVEGTKRKLLDAATAEFSAFGLAGARVDRIAREAGVNKERIYEYFGKKDELFTAVLLDQLALASEAVPIRGVGIDAVLDYVGRLFDHHVDVPALARLTAWEGLELGGAVGAELRIAHVNRKLGAFRLALPDLPESAARELQLSIVVLVCGWQSLPNVDGLYREAAEVTAERIAVRRAETVATVEARLSAALPAGA